MENKRPLILISNDDGFQSKGINELIKFVSSLGDIVVMAPNGPRSGYSSAITATAPVRYQLVRCSPGLSIYQCSGTPTDCIKLAKTTVLDRKPDLVIAGINHGDNAGINAIYSGTMGAVIEGCLNGIPSIGYSIDDHRLTADFSHCAEPIRLITAKVLQEGLPAGVCLNVNFPATGEIKGIRVCRQSKGVWEHEWVKQTHPRGFDFYWLTGEFQDQEPDNEETDTWAFRNGYASITPTSIDLTAYQMIEQLKSWNL
jgi:5'-nucleotidase